MKEKGKRPETGRPVSRLVQEFLPEVVSVGRKGWAQTVVEMQR